MYSIRQALFGMAVEHDAVTKALFDLLLEEIAELSYLALITRQIGLRDLAGLPQTHGEDDVFGTSTTSRFMPGAVDQRFQRAAGAHVQRPNTLGGIELMTSNGQKIDTKLIDERGDFAYGLRRVRMHQHTMRTSDTADLGNGLERTHLVIGVHNTNEEGLGRDGFADIIRIDHARPIHREIRHLQTLLFQETAEVEGGRVLDRRGNNVATSVSIGIGNSLQDSIIRLTPPTREHDFRSGASQERCDPGSGALHRFFGGLAISMRAGRVPV